MKTVFNIVDIHSMLRIHNDKVMTVAFMVAKKKIFTQRGALSPIILSSYLNSGCLRMFIIFKSDS